MTIQPPRTDVTTVTYSLSSELIDVEISDMGGTLVSVRAPDRTGNVGEICLGFPDSHSYETSEAFLGALVGRVANRIGGSTFELDGEIFTLEANEPPNHLHGGSTGFHRVRWKATRLDSPEGESLRLFHRSPDQSGGYPGNLDVEARYTVTNRGRLDLEFKARTDRPTPVSLTHHPYWSLSGEGTIHDHVLQVAADQVTVTSTSLLPTGAFRSVHGSPLDLTSPTLLGPVIEATGGLDHNYVLRHADGTLRFAALLWHPGSGRRIRIYTTLPGLQVYTGGKLDGAIGHGGRPHIPFSGVCLEPQLFPDAIHRPEFASPILRPGESWSHAIRIEIDTVS